MNHTTSDNWTMNSQPITILGYEPREYKSISQNICKSVSPEYEPPLYGRIGL